MKPLRDETSIETLRQAATLLERENQTLVRKVVELQKEILRLKGQTDDELQLRIAELEAQLAKQRQMLFGKSTEQRSVAKPPKEPPAQPPRGHGPTKQESLPVVEEIHQLDEPDKTCPQCGGQLAEWEGQFEESEEVDAIERRFVVRKHKRQKYRCKCQACVETALGPPRLIEGGRYSPDFAIEVAVAKYLDHTPLQRQVRIMAREGLVVTAQTLWDQIDAAAAHLARAHERLHEYVLTKPVIGTDETHWKFLGDNGGEHAQTRWQAWTVVGDDAICYRIVPSRSAEAARTVLREFRGVVMADGYGVYEHLAKHDGIVLANCWAHARRKFFELDNIIPEAAREEILGLIGELYRVEREATDEESRRRLRDERSRAVIDRIRQWLFAQKQQALPRSALGKAVVYTLERWTGLTRFLDDPRIPLDNNASERALRGPVIGRKVNYGSKSERGTVVAALFYSLCESAKLCGVEPKAYLRGALWAALREEEIPLPHELRAQLRAAATTTP